MRAVFSLLSLVVVLVIVLLMAKRQASELKSLPATNAASAAVGSAGLPAPKAVGQQVQGLMDDAARRAAEAASAATN